MLWCIWPNQSEGANSKYKWLELLLKNGSKLNTRNITTNWTEFHWLALCGESECMELLIDYGAAPFLSSFDGLYPIDLAAINNSRNGVRICIRETIKHLIEKRNWKSDKMLTWLSSTNHTSLGNLSLKNPKKIKKLRDVYELNSMDIYFLFNPMLHTKLLYYAVKFSVDPNVIQKILNTTSAIPEGPVMEELQSTPLHAAWRYNNQEALKLLCENLKSRENRIETSSISTTTLIHAENLCDNFESVWK